MNLKSKLEQDEKKFGVGAGGSDTFRFEDGKTSRLRVLTEWATIGQHYLGKGIKPVVCVGQDEGCAYHGDQAPQDEEGNPLPAKPRFILYVLDRTDGKVKLAFFPYTIIRKITDLSGDPEWTWEEWPMPYDLSITYDKKKGAANMYSIIASPKREPVLPEIIAELEGNERLSPADIAERMKQKQLAVEAD